MTTDTNHLGAILNHIEDCPAAILELLQHETKQRGNNTSQYPIFIGLEIDDSGTEEWCVQLEVARGTQPGVGTDLRADVDERDPNLGTALHKALAELRRQLHLR